MPAFLISISQFLAKGKGALYLLFLRVFSTFMGLVFTLLISRLMSVQAAGYFFYGVALVLVLGRISRMGLDKIFIKEFSVLYAARRYHALGREFLSGLVLVLVLPLLASLVLCLFSDSFSQLIFDGIEFSSYLFFFSFSLPFVCLSLYLSLFLVSVGDYFGNIVGINLGQVVISSLFFLMIFYSQSDSIYFAVAYAVASVVVFLFLSTRAAKFLSFSSLRFHAKSLLKYLERSKSMVVVALFLVAITWSSQLLLGLWSDAEDVAMFAVAQRASMFVAFVMGALEGMVTSNLSVYYKEGKLVRFQSYFVKMTRLTTFLSLPIFIVMVVFPANILSVFGVEYREASNVLVVMSIGQLFGVFSGYLGAGLVASGAERYLRTSAVIAGFSAIALNAILIPMYGSLGAAFAMLFGVTVLNFTAGVYFCKHLQFNYLTSLFAVRSRKEISR